MRKIFIVEDDQSILASLKLALKEDFQIASVENFSAVKQEVQEKNPDLLLMDISLPYFNGFYWTTEIRKFSNLPIIFISSADEEMNAIMAMNMGADDFIAKPFSIEILKAKIHALLRRTGDFTVNSNFSFGEYTLSLDGELSHKDYETISLTGTENRILRQLFEHVNQVVTKEEILENLWQGEDFLDNNALQVNIARLRKKLHKMDFDFIHTIRGVGYLLK